MLHRERVTARMEQDFAVFLIGMRVNAPLMVHKWLPVALAMPRMLKELYAHPELGLLSHEMWMSRTLILVQYWRNIEALLAYAKAKDAEHLPAWRQFNRRIGTDGTVGIWHETYQARPGTYETVYVNMPEFGLGKAGARLAATSSLQSAAGRLQTS